MKSPVVISQKAVRERRGLAVNRSLSREECDKWREVQKRRQRFEKKGEFAFCFYGSLREEVLHRCSVQMLSSVQLERYQSLSNMEDFPEFAANDFPVGPVQEGQCVSRTLGPKGGGGGGGTNPRSIWAYFLHRFQPEALKKNGDRRPISFRTKDQNNL